MNRNSSGQAGHGHPHECVWGSLPFSRNRIRFLPGGSKVHAIQILHAFQECVSRLKGVQHRRLGGNNETPVAKLSSFAHSSTRYLERRQSEGQSFIGQGGTQRWEIMIDGREFLGEIGELFLRQVAGLNQISKLGESYLVHCESN